MKCKCLTEVDQKLKEKGFRLSKKLVMYQIDDQSLSLNLVIGWPLERLDDARLRDKDPLTMQMSFCPFCGEKLGK